MFKGNALLALSLAATLSTPVSAAVSWNAWSVGSAAPIVSGGSVTFQVTQEQSAVWVGGQLGSKDFYSTAFFNGRTMGSLAGGFAQYTITGPASELPPNVPNDGLRGPYVNIVVTDGTGFAYLLLDASPSPLGQQFHDFSTAMYRVNEGNLAGFNNGQWYGLSDIAGLTIASGGFGSNTVAVAPIAGWSGFGLTDSFAFISGNRGSSPVPEITIDGVSVPEPGTLALLGLGLAGLAAARRRKQ